MRTIGIIGQGFVGSSVKAGLEYYFKIETYDVIEEKSTVSNIEELFDKSEIIFVCLPTPMKSSGQCDTSIIEPVFQKLNSFHMHNTELGTYYAYEKNLIFEILLLNLD